MAPRVPDEIDVFTVPHSRMKELVNIYTQKMERVDFRDGPEVVSLLRGLDCTLQEFKSHESIENIFIMDQLKTRLKQRHISNTAVCDCHDDNRLADVVQVMRTGVGVKQSSVGERLRFGLRLQRAFLDFVSNFLPHMEEEEQVFQPLLVEHFEYEELKILKEVVLKEHEVVKELGWEKGQQEEQWEGETCPDVKDLRDLDCLHLEDLGGLCGQVGGSCDFPGPTCCHEEEEENEREQQEEQHCQEQLIVDWNESRYPDLSHHDADRHCKEDKSSIGSYNLNKRHIRTDSLEKKQVQLINSWEVDKSHPRDARQIWNNNWNQNEPKVKQLLFEESWNESQELFNITNKQYEEKQENQESYSVEWSNCQDTLLCEPQDRVVSSLPGEVLVEIFSHLTPPDLCRCAQVSHAWNVAALTPGLWSALYPVQWARGIWEPRNVGLGGALEEAAGQGVGVGRAKWDEDADVDESEQEPDPLAAREHTLFQSVVTWLLPRVGCGVTTLVVEAGQGITSRLLHHALRLCPILTTLTTAHTLIDSYAFKGVWGSGGLGRLRHLDLQGCQLVDDTALVYLARCGPSPPSCRHPDRYSRLREQQEASWEWCHHCGHCTCWSGAAYLYVDWRKDGDCTHHHLHFPDNSSQTHRYVLNEGSLKCNMYNFENKNASETDIEEIHCQSKSFVAQEIVAVNSQYGRRAHHTPEYFEFNKEFDSGCSEIHLLPNHSRQMEDISLDRLHLHNFSERTDSSTAEESRVSRFTSQMHTDRSESEPHSDFTRWRETMRWSGLRLETLNLSGCWQVTDTGLGTLAGAGAVSGLTSLDVSGCYRLSGRGLGALAAACPTLRPNNLWYCDNIDDGPYPLRANGCANLANPVRVCCRNGR